MTPNFDKNMIIQELVDTFHSIGYKHTLIEKNYAFNDFIASKPTLRTVSLAVFGQEPMDYRSACFGVDFLNDNNPSANIANQLRAFGAPQIFLIKNGRAEWWKNQKTDTLRYKEVATSSLSKLIKENSEHWNPEKMIRLKSGFLKPKPQQLDFIDIGLLPALENQASAKIDSLISRILYNAEKKFKLKKLPFDSPAIFNIVFLLLTAKLLKDRNILTTPEIDLTQPFNALNAVSNFYGKFSPVSCKAESLQGELLLDIAKEIHTSFSLSNLSVDTLSYVYENTFVSKKSRKNLGIHSTPSYVAEHILNQLPIEELPRSKWHVLDPMCGHGIFLIAAMRKMRSLLPSGWTGKQRHNFFSRRLHGIEIDSFSADVARLCLTLADFPESNGWDLKVEDAFAGKSLETIAGKITILIGNPPFETIENMKPETPKPKELLRRILPKLPEGALFGCVLPLSFLDGSDYRAERQMFSRFFEIINITTLPDRVFKYSDAETAVFIARKHKSSPMPKTICRHVREEDRTNFKLYSRPTFEDIVPVSYFEQKMQGLFVIPPLREIWEKLERNPQFKEIAEVKTGVEYEPGLLEKHPTQIVSEKPFPGSSPGIFKVTQGFQQFAASDTVYMSTKKEHRRKMVSGTWELDWQKPKVVIPKSIMSRGPWRFAAVIDKKGLIIRRRFFAVWPKEKDFTVELLAAILNSPVAQAFVYTHSHKRDITKRIYDSIPVPSNLKDIAPLITELVKEYLELIESDQKKARKMLLEIDSAILQLYNLPARLEKQILDLFSGRQRPVPHDFTGYPPKGLPAPTKRKKLPQAGLNSEVIDFCEKKEISEYLEKSLDIIHKCFPSIQDLRMLPEQDPETEQQWLLIDITVDGDIDEVLQNYDNYIDEWVSSVPEPARENIRLSYNIY